MAREEGDANASWVQRWRSRWARWTQPKVDILDEAEARQASLVLNILLLLFIAAIAAVLVDSFVPEQYLGPIEENATLQIAAMLPLLGVAWWLTKRGYTTAGSALIVLSVWGGIMLSLLLMPDAAPGLLLMFLALPIILSGLLLPLSYTIVITVATPIILVAALDATEVFAFPLTLIVGFLLFAGVALGIQRFRERDLERIAEQARELEASQRRLQTLLGATFETIVLLHDNKIVDANPAFDELFDQDVDEANQADTRLESLLEAPDGTTLRQALNTARTHSVELNAIRGEERIPVEARVRSLDTEQGNNILVLRDLTDRKQAEAERTRRAKEETRREEMEQLAWTTSHALRTPIRTIKSFAQLLQRELHGQIPDEIREDLSTLIDGAEDLDRTTQDLRFYAETVQRELQPERIEMDQIVRETVRSLGLLKDKAHHLELDELPAINGDPLLVRRLLLELVGNAQTHNEGPELKITISAEPVIGEEMIRFTIADNGNGIPPRFHERVFEMFERLEPQAGPAGSGLGLSLCKRVVENHGGKIWIEGATEGKTGTRVHFTLPEPGATIPGTEIEATDLPVRT